jgi:hypothetical protein
MIDAQTDRFHQMFETVKAEQAADPTLLEHCEEDLHIEAMCEAHRRVFGTEMVFGKRHESNVNLATDMPRNIG